MLNPVEGERPDGPGGAASSKDGPEGDALSKDAPKKPRSYKTIGRIPVRKNGAPCATWKGYAIVDRSDTTRQLTCLMEIEEWVHLVGNKVKLYDRFNNYNGELEKEDYILYRKDRKRFERLKKKRFEEPPVKRVPLLDKP